MAAPRRAVETKLLSEIMKLENMFAETPGRKFTVAHLWNVLPKVRTVLPKATKENEDKNVVEPTGNEEVELSVMTDLSMMEETNVQIQGGVDNLNDLIEEAARDVEFDNDAEEVEEDRNNYSWRTGVY